MATEISVLAVTTNPSLVIGLTFSGRGFDIDSTFELSGPVSADVLVVDTADAEASIAAISRLGAGRPPVVLITDRAIDSLPDRVRLCLRPYTLDALGDEIEAALQQPVVPAPSAPPAPSRPTPPRAPARAEPPVAAPSTSPPPEPDVAEPADEVEGADGVEGADEVADPVGQSDSREPLFASWEDEPATDGPPSPPPPPPAAPSLVDAPNGEQSEASREDVSEAETGPEAEPDPEVEPTSDRESEAEVEVEVEAAREPERHLHSVDTTPALFGVPPDHDAFDAQDPEPTQEPEPGGEPEAQIADEPDDRSTTEPRADIKAGDDTEAEPEIQEAPDVAVESGRDEGEAGPQREPEAARPRKRSWRSFLAPKAPDQESSGPESREPEPEHAQDDAERSGDDDEPQIADPATPSISPDEQPLSEAPVSGTGDAGESVVDREREQEQESAGGLVYQGGRWQPRFVEIDEDPPGDVTEPVSSAEDDGGAATGASSAEDDDTAVDDDTTAAGVSSAEDDDIAEGDETTATGVSSAEDDGDTAAGVSSAEEGFADDFTSGDGVVDDLFSQPEPVFDLDGPAPIDDERDQHPDDDEDDENADEDVAGDLVDAGGEDHLDAPAAWSETAREPLRSVQPPTPPVQPMAPPATTAATAGPRTTAPATRGVFRRFSRRPVELSERETDMRTRLASVLMAASELERVVGDLPVIADHTELCAAIVQEVRATFGADTAAYYLQHEDGWHVVAGHGLTSHQTTSVVTSDQPMLSEVHASGGGLLIDPVEAVPAAVVGIAGAHTESVMAASVSVGPGRYGLLFVGRDEPLTEADLDRLVALATEAAPGVAVSELIARIGGLVDKG